jgi:hypothetical protein
MSENPAIFGGVQGVGSSRPRGQITEKAPAWRKRQIEACLDPNRRLSGECRFKGSICFLVCRKQHGSFEGLSNEPESSALRLPL